MPREDVAAALAGIVERPDFSRIIIELTGGDTPVADVLARLAEHRP